MYGAEHHTKQGKAGGLSPIGGDQGDTMTKYNAVSWVESGTERTL